MNSKGFYITLSGGEHAGKSSHIRELSDFLTDRGLECIVTREPGGTRIGTKIREILLDPENVSLSNNAELFLYAANRAQQFAELNIPVLESGVSVLSDRCFLETEAYQGHARGLNIDVIKYLNNISVAGYLPDVSFIIDGDPSEMSRNSDRELGDFDRLDLEKLDFHKKVREGFLSISKEYSFCEVVPYIKNGQKQMQEQMQDILSNKFNL